MDIKIVRYSDPLRLNLARNAAIYLGKEDKDNIRRPLNILRMGHTLEIFRGESVEFLFNGVSKEVYDHLTTYTTRNMRVTCGNRAKLSNGWVMPSDKMKLPSFVGTVIQEVHKWYHELANTESPQVARSAMPCGATMNEFVIQFNFATLMQAVFPQRIWTHGAQGNTRIVVQRMYELLLEEDKELWETVEECYGAKMQAWMQAYRKLRKMERGDIIIEGIIEEFGKTKNMWE